MISLIQRVSSASVVIDGEQVSGIGVGLLVLLCVQPDDTPAKASRMGERLATYRMFPDENGRMNLSVTDAGGQILLVPQFTLAADTAKGTRPSFSSGASPELGKSLFQYLSDEIANSGLLGGQGRFGADMQVSLTNDGPVTFWLTV